MFSGPTSYAESVDSVMLFIIGISVVLLLGITFSMIFFAIKYNRKRHPKAEQIEGNLLLEIIWIGLPTVLVIAMFWYGYAGYSELRATADQAMVVNVSAKMWEWSFNYDNGKKTDTLYIPVGKTTRLDMTSEDVNHSLYIPAFRLKEDVVAGRTTYLILTPEEVGAYDIACAEYCGQKHSMMYTKLVVLPEYKFDKWLETESDTLSVAQVDIVKHISVFKEKGCVTCHSFDGSKMTGPSFTALRDGEVTVITDGEERIVDIDEDYLRKSILEPNADIVKGYTKYMMPDISDTLSDDELEELIVELKKIIEEK